MDRRPASAREGWPAWDEALRSLHAPQSQQDLPHHATAAAGEDEGATIGDLRLPVRPAAGKGVVSRGTGLAGPRPAKPALCADLLPRYPRHCRDCAGYGATLRMSRLLQGDVGSGKTLVAFLALLIAVEAAGRGADGPHRDLARQHLESLSPLAEAAGVRLVLLTGRDKGAERRAKLAALAQGEVQILVGTHAVFQKKMCIFRIFALPWWMSSTALA